MNWKWNAKYRKPQFTPINEMKRKKDKRTVRIFPPPPSHPFRDADDEYVR